MSPRIWCVPARPWSGSPAGAAPRVEARRGLRRRNWRVCERPSRLGRVTGGCCAQRRTGSRLSSLFEISTGAVSSSDVDVGVAAVSLLAVWMPRPGICCRRPAGAVASPCGHEHAAESGGTPLSVVISTGQSSRRVLRSSAPADHAEMADRFCLAGGDLACGCRRRAAAWNARDLVHQEALPGSGTWYVLNSRRYSCSQRL